MSAVLRTSARQVLRCNGSINQIYNAMADEQNNAGRAGSMCVCVCVRGAWCADRKDQAGAAPPMFGPVRMMKGASSPASSTSLGMKVAPALRCRPAEGCRKPFARNTCTVRHRTPQAPQIAGFCCCLGHEQRSLTYFIQHWTSQPPQQQTRAGCLKYEKRSLAHLEKAFAKIQAPFSLFYYPRQLLQRCGNC